MNLVTDHPNDFTHSEPDFFDFDSIGDDGHAHDAALPPIPDFIERD